MNEYIKHIEKLLQDAMQRHLKEVGTLRNLDDESYVLGRPACSDLCLSIRDERELDLLRCVVDCNSNYHPCILGYVTLTCRKPDETAFTTESYVFHINGDKSAIGGDADYDIIETNEGRKINIHNVDYFCHRYRTRLY